MKIAVIGGGFTGLAAAYHLTKKGHDVAVFEKDATLGGLAHGFQQPEWQWHLEYAYHHFFTNDHAPVERQRVSFRFSPKFTLISRPSPS